MSVALARHALRKTVGRNPVRAFGEDGHAVDDESKTLARRVRLLPQLKCAQARARREFVGDFVTGQEARAQRVELWRAEPRRPPELRIRNGELEREAVRARR